MTGPHGGLSVPCPGNRREQWARPGGGEVTRGVATGEGARRERDCLPGHCLPLTGRTAARRGLFPSRRLSVRTVPREQTTPDRLRGTLTRRRQQADHPLRLPPSAATARRAANSLTLPMGGSGKASPGEPPAGLTCSLGPYFGNPASQRRTPVDRHPAKAHGTLQASAQELIPGCEGSGLGLYCVSCCGQGQVCLSVSVLLWGCFWLFLPAAPLNPGRHRSRARGLPVRPRGVWRTRAGRRRRSSPVSRWMGSRSPPKISSGLRLLSRSSPSTDRSAGARAWSSRSGQRTRPVWGSSVSTWTPATRLGVSLWRGTAGSSRCCLTATGPRSASGGSRGTQPRSSLTSLGVSSTSSTGAPTRRPGTRWSPSSASRQQLPGRRPPALRPSGQGAHAALPHTTGSRQAGCLTGCRNLPGTLSCFCPRSRKPVAARQPGLPCRDAGKARVPRPVPAAGYGAVATDPVYSSAPSAQPAGRRPPG